MDVPGAGSIQAGNYVYGVAPQDGTVLGNILNTVPLVQIMGLASAQFDLWWDRHHRRAILNCQAVAAEHRGVGQERLPPHSRVHAPSHRADDRRPAKG